MSISKIDNKFNLDIKILILKIKTCGSIPIPTATHPDVAFVKTKASKKQDTVEKLGKIHIYFGPQRQATKSNITDPILRNYKIDLTSFHYNANLHLTRSLHARPPEVPELSELKQPRDQRV